MRIPRDTSAPDLIKALRSLGYAVTRQTGSHIRVTTTQDGQHHETILNHAPIKAGTLNGVLKSIAGHHRISVEQLLQMLEL